MTTFNAKVIDISFEGQGVVKHPDGRVFFVWGVWLGEEGVFEITRDDKKYGFAKLNELKSSHPRRRTAPCRFHGFSKSDCSGCSWMFIDEAEQRVQKRNGLQKLFERNLQQIANDCVKPVIFTGEDLGYRRRSRLRTNGRDLGFINRDTKSLVHIDDCIVLSEKTRERMRTVRDTLKVAPLSQLGFIDITEELPTDKDLQDLAKVLNQKTVFQQASSAVNSSMKMWLKDFLADLKISPRVILELFSGSGNFTEILKSQFPTSALLALECEQQAVDQLREKEWTNTEVARCDLFLEKDRGRVIQGTWLSPDLLFLDPPRAGFADLFALVQKLEQIPATIVYVSCDPASFARDIRSLVGDLRGSTEGDYTLKVVQPFDAFSQTPHLEIIGIMERKISP